MLPNQYINIRGAFKFDVYESGGNLKASNRIDNFITSTGLCFPAYYAFADCFRFLSLGSGTTANTIIGGFNGWGTTGLSIPLSSYSYIGSRTDNNSPLSTQYETEACGYREEGNKVVLSRGWRLPTGSGLFDNSFTFNEFMLSPGRPAVTGAGRTEACSCADSVLDDIGNQLVGQDCAQIAQFYTNPTICKAYTAFSRIVTGISVLPNDYLVVTYDLNVTYQTGLKQFGIHINNSKGGTNWSGTLTGFANIVHHGIKLINNGNINSVNGPQATPREQIPLFSFTNDYGESFVPSWGAPLEPSSIEANLAVYLSTDDIQFVVNSVSGGALPTGNFQPYNPTGSNQYSSGIMSWHSMPSSEVANNFNQRYFGIRSDGRQIIYANPADFSSEVTADSFSFDVSTMQASALQHTHLNNSFIKTGRNRASNYSCQFWGWKANNAGFANKPIRAIVLAYKDSTSAGDVPFYDVIIGNSSKQVLPTIDTGAVTYTPPGTNYFFMEDGGDLTLQFDMSWSSPCENGVIGC